MMVVLPLGCDGGGAPTQPAKPRSCNRNSDCKTAALPICSNHVCIAGPSSPDKGAGESCSDDSECASGLVCDNGKCTPTSQSPGAACQGNDDCAPGLICEDGQCTPGGISTDDAGGGQAGIPNGCGPVVNELQSGGVTASDEWVELFNPCTAAIDLDGWKLAYRSAGNNSGRSDLLLVALTQKISAGGYLLFVGGGYTGSAKADGKWSGGHLAGDGGAVGLRDAGGKLIDSVAYQTLTTTNGFTEGAPAPNPEANSSIERLPNGADSDDNSKDFQTTPSPTPGAANR
jgi:hypothetical protein